MDCPVVSTVAGSLLGAVQQTCEGVDYYSFKGIAYAKPPSRFEDALPVEPWQGLRNATEYGPVCAQSDLTGKIVGGDDCLYLNVYKRVKPVDLVNQLLPVMVWIYGGGFVTGDGNDGWYGPDYFMNKDVVLVTFNYRLGVFGFLNLKHETVPANLGLKDQVMALKWVRDNIRSFGGDPNNVTVFGESAGAVSIHYLALSSLSKGLFHKAIMESGTIQSPWSRSSDPKRYAYRLCKVLGNNTKDPEAAVEFLRSIDSHKLVEAQNKIKTKKEKIQGIFPFGPGMDAKSKNPFMPMDPMEAAGRGIQVPLIIGYNSREGIFSAEQKRRSVKLASITSKSNFEKYLNPNIKSMIKERGLSPEDLRSLYFGDESKLSDEDKSAKEEEKKEEEKEIFEKLIDYFTELYYHLGTLKVIRTQIEKSSADTFFYQYTYDKTPSPIKSFLNVKVKGASHMDELQHLFRMKAFDDYYQPPKKGSDAYKVTLQMIDMWTNFAKSGSPAARTSQLIPEVWPEVKPKSIRYMRINEDIKILAFEPNDRLKFLEKNLTTKNDL